MCSINKLSISLFFVFFNAEAADCHTNKNELHRVLGETGSFLQKTMNDFSDQSDVFSFDVVASPNKSIPQNQDRNKTSSCSDFDAIDDDMNGSGKTSPRACKGKRYMEFMHLQRATMITKRIKPHATSISSSASLSPTQPSQSYGKRSVSMNNGTAHKMDFGTFDHLYANQNIPSSMGVGPGNLSSEIEQQRLAATTNDRHRGDVGDFDLEQKINALPVSSQFIRMWSCLNLFISFIIYLFVCFVFFLFILRHIILMNICHVNKIPKKRRKDNTTSDQRMVIVRLKK